MDWLDDELDHDDMPCPACGAHEVRSRGCDAVDCEDGYIDEYEQDPLNFSPGEEYTVCSECLGTGILRWCAKCGCDITLLEHQARQE